MVKKDSKITKKQYDIALYNLNKSNKIIDSKVKDSVIRELIKDCNCSNYSVTDCKDLLGEKKLTAPVKRLFGFLKSTDYAFYHYNKKTVNEYKKQK